MIRIVTIVICAGVTVGLVVGHGIDVSKRNTGLVAAVVLPSVENTNATPNVVKDILLDKEFSNAIYGVQSTELTALGVDLQELKTELSKVTRDSDAYNEILDKIHELWGRISICAGELNSNIDEKTAALAQISENTLNNVFTIRDIHDLIEYPVEEC